MDAQQQQGIADLRSHLQQFEARVDTRFGQIDGRIAALDRTMDHRLTEVRREMDEQFRWFVTVIFIGMVAFVVASILAR